MTILLPRRRFLLGLGAALAAPAIVRFESLMPVRAITPITYAGDLIGPSTSFHLYRGRDGQPLNWERFYLASDQDWMRFYDAIRKATK